MKDIELVVNLVDEFYKENTIYNQEFNSDVLTFIFMRVMYHYYNENQIDAYFKVNKEITYNLEYFDKYEVNVFDIFDILDLVRDFYLNIIKKESINPKFLAYFSALIIQFYNVFKSDAKDILMDLINSYRDKNSNFSLDGLINYLSKVSVIDIANNIYNPVKSKKLVI